MVSLSGSAVLSSLRDDQLASASLLFGFFLEEHGDFLIKLPEIFSQADWRGAQWKYIHPPPPILPSLSSVACQPRGLRHGYWISSDLQSRLVSLPFPKRQTGLYCWPNALWHQFPHQRAVPAISKWSSGNQTGIVTFLGQEVLICLWMLPCWLTQIKPMCSLFSMHVVAEVLHFWLMKGDM